MLFVCSSRSQKLPLNIVWGRGVSKGQAKRAKVDHSDEIGVKRVNVSTILSLIVDLNPPFSYITPLQDNIILSCNYLL